LKTQGFAFLGTTGTRVIAFRDFQRLKLKRSMAAFRLCCFNAYNALRPSTSVEHVTGNTAFTNRLYCLIGRTSIGGAVQVEGRA
jgi:hypothetical protein